MTNKQYRGAIKSLGLSQRKAAVFLGIDERTSRRYALGETKVPQVVCKALQLKLSLEILKEERKSS